MNRYYLVDDDLAIINVLKLIIEKNGVGVVCGHAQNAEDALDDLPHSRPDIVIVDMLMPTMDGITFVAKARAQYGDIYFIMLSQVSSKNLIAQAYEAGVEFFIQKPVNSVEVLNVLGKLERYLKMNATYQQMQALFAAMQPGMPPLPPAPPPHLPEVDEPATAKTSAVLQKLGIGGDIASRDIVRTVCYIQANQNVAERMTVVDICKQLADSPKAMEQRMRRAVAAGLVNLAHMGLEDYADDIFTHYAGVLYRFEQVRREMDFVRGTAATHGKASLRAFLFALADMGGDL